MNKNKKNSIQIIKLLSNDFIRKDEILDRLELKDAIFYKYMGLIKKAGFKIKRKSDLYKLLFFSNKIDFDSADIIALASLSALSKINFSKRKTDDFSNIIDKIIYLSNNENYLKMVELLEYLDIKPTPETLKQLENHILKRDILKVTLKDKSELVLKPLNFDYGIKKIYVNFLDTENKETKRINLSEIAKFSKYIPIYHSFEEKRETIFELYGNLASTYLLREDERVVDKTSEKLVIANSSSDKNILFRRLLRYDILCKVVLPKKDVTIFQKLIEKSIKNLGS